MTDLILHNGRRVAAVYPKGIRIAGQAGWSLFATERQAGGTDVVATVAGVNGGLPLPG
jgi:hypothetical protein